MPILPQEPMIFPGVLLQDNSEQDIDKVSTCGLTAQHYHPGSAKWMVAHTRPRQEKALSRYLFSRRIPYFLPQSSRVSQRPRQQTDSWIPLFPGYVFIYTDPAGGIEALQSNRIAAMLHVTDQTALIRDLRRIRRVIESGMPLYPEDKLLPGHPVRIISGALMGLEGLVEARLGICRFIVTVDFIGKGVSVEVNARNLEPLDSDNILPDTQPIGTTGHQRPITAGTRLYHNSTT